MFPQFFPYHSGKSNAILIFSCNSFKVFTPVKSNSIIFTSITYYCELILRVSPYDFLVLIRNGCCPHLNKMTQIGRIVENLLDGSTRPKVMRTAGIGDSELFFLVIGMNRYMLVIKGLCNLVGTDTACPHCKHSADIACRRFVNYRQFLTADSSQHSFAFYIYIIPYFLPHYLTTHL